MGARGQNVKAGKSLLGLIPPGGGIKEKLTYLKKVNKEERGKRGRIQRRDRILRLRREARSPLNCREKGESP